MQVHVQIFVRLTSIHCQFTACYRPYSVKHNVHNEHTLIRNMRMGIPPPREMSR